MMPHAYWEKRVATSKESDAICLTNKHQRIAPAIVQYVICSFVAVVPFEAIVLAHPGRALVYHYNCLSRPMSVEYWLTMGPGFPRST